MKPTHHQLMLFTNEDYRENVLRTLAGKESAQDLIDDLNKGGQMNMATIGESAQDYEPAATTKNIADLDKVSTALELVDDEFEFNDKVTGEPKKVTQQVIVIEDVKYRVPKTVIQQLKVLLEDNPELKNFKVKKSGSTKDDTRYQVIPVVD